jgi:hypothetical protein
MGMGILLAAWYLVLGNFLHLTVEPKIDSIPAVQPFMTGIVAPLFSLAGILLLFVNLWQAQATQAENAFFKMLDNHHKIVQNIVDYIPGIDKNPNYKSEKQYFFDDLCYRIWVDYNLVDFKTADTVGMFGLKRFVCKPMYRCKGKQDPEAKLMAVYGHYYHIYQSILGHYFRNLYHMVKFVENSKVMDKRVYMGLLRAQLSNYELVLLAYNGMYKYGIKKFKPLIEKHKLLKTINFEEDLSEEYGRRIIPDLHVLTAAYPHLMTVLEIN